MMNNMTAENVRAQRVVKAYVREEFEKNKFSKLSAKIYKNIANVNTVAFKAARTTFKDTYSQLTRAASGSSGDREGIKLSRSSTLQK